MVVHSDMNMLSAPDYAVNMLKLKHVITFDSITQPKSSIVSRNLKAGMQ
jgi:hypothetical protein